MWLKHQTMLVNENRLNLADQRARQYLARQMEQFFFGGGVEQPAGYVPPGRLNGRDQPAGRELAREGLRNSLIHLKDIEHY